MARKPLVTTQEPAPMIELRPEATEAANLMAVVQTSYDDERDLANQLLGQIQMANAFGKWTTVVYLSKLEQVRKNKLYRALPAKNVTDNNGNEIADCRLNTWDGYCRALGLSANKVEEDLKNLEAFGQDAIENMGRLGIGYREMRQFRKLPQDQRTALIEAAKSDDKESFLELAEDLIAKHAKEKESLQTDLARAKEAAADKDCVIEQKNKKIGELVEQMNRQAALTDAERATEQERALNDAVIETLGGLVVLNQRIAEIRNTGEKTPHGLYIACQGALNRVIEEVIAVSNDWGIAIDPMAGFGAAADVAMPDNTAAGEAAYYDDPNAGEDVGGEDWTAFAR